jgi:hypothetical protein
MRFIMMALPGIDQMLVPDLHARLEELSHANGVQKVDGELHRSNPIYKYHQQYLEVRPRLSVPIKLP